MYIWYWPIKLASPKFLYHSIIDANDFVWTVALTEWAAGGGGVRKKDRNMADLQADFTCLQTDPMKYFKLQFLQVAGAVVGLYALYYLPAFASLSKGNIPFLAYGGVFRKWSPPAHCKADNIPMPVLQNVWGNQIPIKENGIKRIVNLEKLIVVFHLYMRTGFWIDQTNKVVDIYLLWPWNITIHRVGDSHFNIWLKVNISRILMDKLWFTPLLRKVKVWKY